MPQPRHQDATNCQQPSGAAVGIREWLDSVYDLLVKVGGADECISSMSRADAINVLKEWLIKASGEEEWMKHIK